MTFGGTEARPTYAEPLRAPAEAADEPDAPPPPPRAPLDLGGADGDGWGADAGGMPRAPAPAPAGDADELLVEDDSRWRHAHVAEAAAAAPGGGASPQHADVGSRLLRQCEAWAHRAIQAGQPSVLMRAIKEGSCNAMAGGVKCVLCGPKGPAFTGVSAYYRASSGRVLLCADRLSSEAEVTAALTHELVHAYDHCRRGLHIPLVRTQVPWVLDCATEACTEVRAYSLANFSDTPPWVDKRTLVYRSALASMLNNARSQCGGGDKCASALATIFDLCAADVAPFNDESAREGRRGRFPKMDLPRVAPAAPANSV
ncbi:hypothetical protein KFE25_004007 [Diacronema lutheri]|uniref:Mitochondrial inner membrane protease ATP23 n=2 Tax=Diacronema lutheri TaxID=2081491 RepID=A0A8J6C8L2_DIALT|nr:hypothetical protein KFE25_004007 [Diacronema lutheri]